MTAEPHRAWRSLGPEQHAIAVDLHHRVSRLRDDDPELSLAEAIDIAAIEGGYMAITKPHSGRREYP